MCLFGAAKGLKMDEAAKGVMRALSGEAGEEQKALDGFIRVHARHYEFSSEHTVLIASLLRERLASE